jgi:hypothetical protein
MWWEQPNGTLGLNGTPAAALPLYGSERLAKLPTNAGVLLVEGEKATEAIWGLGLPAVGTVTGASGCPGPEALAVLRQRRAFLWPDADEPGRKHMGRVIQGLTGTASEVRVVRWGRSAGDDAADFVARGGTRDDLIRMVNAAQTPKTPAAEPPANDKDSVSQGLPFVHIKKLLSEPEEERRWLVQDLLLVGGLSLWAAKPKVGKSTLARGLCAAVAQGEPFLGREVTQGPVLYLGLEEQRSEVTRHFRALRVSEEAPLKVYVEIPPADGIERLRVSVEAERPVLVVVDGLFRLIRVLDANAYADLSAKLTPLLELARQNEAHVLLTHHEGKGASDRDGQDGVLGSTAIVGSVDVTFALRKDRATGRRTIRSTARYGEDLPERVLLMDEAGLVTLGETRETEDRADVSSEILESLADGTEPVTEEDLKGRVGGTSATFRLALRDLVTSGKVSRSGAGKRGDPYRYEKLVRSSMDTSTDERRETSKSAPLLRELSSRSLLEPDEKSGLYGRESGVPGPTCQAPTERGEL